MTKKPQMEPDELVRLYNTYPDGWGGFVDWSGVTAIAVCVCGHIEGPCLTEAEVKHDMAMHRHGSHYEPKTNTYLLERVVAVCHFPECAKKATARGFCATHLVPAREAWRQIVGPWCLWPNNQCRAPRSYKDMCKRHSRITSDIAERASCGVPPIPRDADGNIIGGTKNKVCAEPGCEDKAYTYHLCKVHRIKYGQALGDPPPGAPVKLPDDGHGEVRTYVRGCRCDMCKAANAASSKARYVPKEREPRKETPIFHGLSAYRNGRCRCEICREASRAYNARREGR